MPTYFIGAGGAGGSVARSRPSEGNQDGGGGSGGGAEWSWEVAAGPGPADPFQADWPHWEKGNAARKQRLGYEAPAAASLQVPPRGNRPTRSGLESSSAGFVGDWKHWGRPGMRAFKF
jgi:hypothetical protein